MSTTLEHLQALINVKNFSKYESEELLEVDLIGGNDFGFKVKIYPNTGDFVSVYIARESSKTPFSVEEVTCSVRIIDSNDKQCFLQEFTFQNNTREDVFIFGLQQCFNRMELLDLSEELLTDDILSLKFDLFCKGKRVSKSILNIGKALRNLAESFQSEHQLQRNSTQHLLDLTTIVPSLLQSVPLSVGHYLADFLFVNKEWITIETMHGIQHHILFKDGEETLGSKLCAASPVFRGILKSPMQEKEDKKIKIIDFDEITFSNFLRFIDRGEIRWSNDEIEDVYSLYQMSDKYAVLNLMKECSHYLTQNINAENVTVIAKLATMHCDIQLKKAVASFFKKKETLLVGKISPLLLKDIVEKVKFLPLVPGNFKANENTNQSNSMLQIILIQTYEDACILYGVFDEFKMCDMMMKCAQYMKQNITPENANIVLGFVKQYQDHSFLSFVKTYLIENVYQSVNDAFGTSSKNNLTPACSEESLYFLCDSDEDSDTN